jgi:hypothetical protein
MDLNLVKSCHLFGEKCVSRVISYLLTVSLGFAPVDCYICSDGCQTDPRTACLWQDMIGELHYSINSIRTPSISYLYIDNQAHATEVFKAAMAKLQVLGQNTKELIDCSEVNSFGLHSEL